MKLNALRQPCSCSRFMPLWQSCWPRKQVGQSPCNLEASVSLALPTPLPLPPRSLPPGTLHELMHHAALAKLLALQAHMFFLCFVLQWHLSEGIFPTPSHCCTSLRRHLDTPTMLSGHNSISTGDKRCLFTQFRPCKAWQQTPLRYCALVW